MSEARFTLSDFNSQISATGNHGGRDNGNSLLDKQVSLAKILFSYCAFLSFSIFYSLQLISVLKSLP